jgi:hypothetical protein
MANEFPDIPEQETVIVENDISWDVTAEDIDWDEGDILTLPEGVMAKVINQNEAEGRADMFIRFPEGYIEPEHTHEAAHGVLILDGEMHTHGHVLTSGDYVYGQKEPHGPMEYTSEDADYGCLVFASFVGGSPAHRWDDDPNE